MEAQEAAMSSLELIEQREMLPGDDRPGEHVVRPRESMRSQRAASCPALE
jgi:hypothetical protein